MVYILGVYFTLALSDPGRLESSSEKKHINDRFTRLEDVLEADKIGVESVHT